MKILVTGCAAAFCLIGCAGVAMTRSELGKSPGRAPQPGAGTVSDATSEVRIVAHRGGYTSTTTWTRDVTYDQRNQPIDGDWRLGSYSEIRDGVAADAGCAFTSTPANSRIRNP